MTDIVSTPPAPASPAESVVTTPDWWPNIDVNKVRDAISLGGEVPHDRLVEALEQGVISALDELATWQAGKIEEGFASLANVTPIITIDESTRNESLFVSAVSSFAAARLADRNPDLTATREGSDRAEQRRDMASDFRREATHAIRQLKGEARTSSELI